MILPPSRCNIYRTQDSCRSYLGHDLRLLTNYSTIRTFCFFPQNISSGINKKHNRFSENNTKQMKNSFQIFNKKYYFQINLNINQISNNKVQILIKYFLFEFFCSNNFSIFKILEQNI